MAWHSRAQGWEPDARRLRFNASGQLANSRLARRGAGRGGACAGAALPQPVSSGAPPGLGTAAEPPLPPSHECVLPWEAGLERAALWGSVSPLPLSCLREPCLPHSAGTPLLCPPQAVRALSPLSAGNPATFVPSSPAKPLLQSSVSSSIGTPAPASLGTPVPPSSKPRVPCCPQASLSPCSVRALSLHLQSSVSSPHLQGPPSPICRSLCRASHAQSPLLSLPPFCRAPCPPSTEPPHPLELLSPHLQSLILPSAAPGEFPVLPHQGWPGGCSGAAGAS